MTGILILGHGSRAETANQMLFEICDMVKKQGDFDLILPAFLQLSEPSFEEGIEKLRELGATKIVVMPYFLYYGVHLSEDIPNELDKIKEKYREVEIVLARHLDKDQRLADIVIDRIREVG